MQREGLRTGCGSELYFRAEHNCTGKCTMGPWPGPAQRRGRGVSDGGRPPVGGRFRQSDRTPFFRHTPAFGLRSSRKNGYVPTASETALIMIIILSRGERAARFTVSCSDRETGSHGSPGLPARSGFCGPCQCAHPTRMGRRINGCRGGCRHGCLRVCQWQAGQASWALVRIIHHINSLSSRCQARSPATVSGSESCVFFPVIVLSLPGPARLSGPPADEGET